MSRVLAVAVAGTCAITDVVCGTDVVIFVTPSGIRVVMSMGFWTTGSRTRRVVTL
jgi:hypothetical protein